jgi:superfamily II DNA/RNA helicase
MPFRHFQLHERLLAALQRLGFEQPTPVQASLIPRALQGADLLISARTGSGKTLAFLLPTLHRLLTLEPQLHRHSGTLALILVPTRELAKQVLKHCQQLTAGTVLEAAAMTGGDDFKHQVAVLRKNPQILVATPGRLLEHLSQGTPDFDDLQVLIIDEADRMLDMGFSEDVLQIAAHCKPERQTLLLSATLERKGLRAIGTQLLQQAELIDVDPHRSQHSDIQQQIVLADDPAHKERLLLWLLQHESWRKVLVFFNTRRQADQLGRRLEQLDIRSAVLHGEMPQSARNRIMSQYRQGAVNVLLSTDLAARGLDVEAVDLVINFDMARSGDDYVHRIGRTGRAGQQGLAISLISAPEWNLMASIERYLRISFERRHIAQMAGSYKGPKKLKASGKAAGPRNKGKGAGRNTVKSKQRARDKKNKGKRRGAAATAGASSNDGSGYASLKKKR